MRIAIAVESDSGLNSPVSGHFGRCPFYLLADVAANGDIDAATPVANPYFDHHEPGDVPAFIHSHNVNVMISGGMGRRAIAFFQEFGIATATGASGTALDAIQAYQQNQLPTAAPCRESVEHADHEH